MGIDVPLDRWGLPIVPIDPPAVDPELGLTTDEDADSWVPPKPDDDMPVVRFVAIFAYVVLSTVRRYAARAGVQYGRNRWR